VKSVTFSIRRITLPRESISEPFRAVTPAMPAQHRVVTPITGREQPATPPSAPITRPVRIRTATEEKIPGIARAFR
jgi:hypothetical protein